LDQITHQYPEISVSYIANPAFDYPVYMNNGWKPDPDFDTESRTWYQELMASEKEWIISEPYFDAQTGIYCVTFAERVYDDKTGEWIGNFGIDFYMDKLIDILGNSYSDNGYAFLTDASGYIINHPNGRYQMSKDLRTNINSLSYGSIVPDGKTVGLFKDYDNRWKTLIAESNVSTSFTVYVVGNIRKIYGNVIVYGMASLVAFIFCVITVYRLMTRLMVMQDRVNENLRKSAEAAIAAGNAKTSFLAQMSHEIRTPINAVLGMNEMILRECADSSIREYSLNIKSAGRTLLSLINSILDFSKIEDGKMEILAVEYDTAAVINDLINAITPRAAAGGLNFIVNIDPTLPAMLSGDDVRIRQIISNLLTNAVKYTEKGSVTFLIRGENRTKDSIELYVAVIDTGIGIRDEDLSKLYESFIRLDEKRNRNIEGTGLGISIVTRLLAMMNSELSVESVYGEGSTFGFRLKQGIVDPAPIGNDYRRASADDDDQSKEHLYAPDVKVLVVDDNEMNLKVAVNLLKIHGIIPDTAASGQKTVELAESKKYDMIFLDHMMPKMDGIETLRELKRLELLPESTVVIALTANAVLGAKEMYLEAGFSDYLSKPIEGALLEKKLAKYLPPEKLSYRKNQLPEIKPAQSGEDSDSFSYAELADIREKCPSLNVMTGMGYCMDSREFYLDTLQGYYDSDKREELEKAFAKNDLDNYRIIVHSVKSASLTIGAVQLSEHARILEFAARDGDHELIRSRHGDLIKEYTDTVEGIGKVLKK
ncbi:MAG: response regulator, partial [Ruminococcus sp.]|nr:response regulator [Ruminococcus sp.]